MRFRTNWLLAACTAGAIALSGCQTPAGPNEQSGVVIGALLGGVLGSQLGSGSGRTAATIVGSVIGSQVAGNIGRAMDATDRMRTTHSLENIRTGVSTRWRNPDTGNQYTVTPTQTYDSPAGPCREYTVDAIIGGRSEQVFGRACRQADGSWKQAR